MVLQQCRLGAQQPAFCGFFFESVVFIQYLILSSLTLARNIQ